MGVVEMAKAGAAALPWSGRLPFLPGGGGEMPELERRLEPAPADLDRLAAYSHLCGFTLRDRLPVTWPHIAAFDLHMRIVTDGRFPFGPMGLVHIANEITQHRPIGVTEALTVSARTAPVVSHPKGRAFSLLSEARVGDELVWEERSTMLKRGGGSANANGEPSTYEETGERARGGNDRGRVRPKSQTRRRQGSAEGSAELESEELRRAGAPPITAWWNLPGDLGVRYGAVSGDRNPIHLHGLTAKPLGFPGAIAHGMWTKARCLAALESRLPDSFTVGVRFGKPVVLPTRVGFAHRSGDGPDEIEFCVLPRRAGSPHLSGSIRTRR